MGKHYNGLKEYKTFGHYQKFVDKNGRAYRGDEVAFVEIDDGSMANIWFRGYVPIKMYENTGNVDKWKELDLKLTEEEFTDYQFII